MEEKIFYFIVGLGMVLYAFWISQGKNYEKLLKAKNNAQGVPTKITKQTHNAGRVHGFLFLCLGIVLILVGLNQ